MGNFGCGDGGWTLAMKINGNKVQISTHNNILHEMDVISIFNGPSTYDIKANIFI